MNENVIDIINKEFEEEEREFVINELSSINLTHVMAESEINLNNTFLSILKLAKGDVNQVISLTKSAKIDFRDVIMWATQSN